MMGLASMPWSYPLTLRTKALHFLTDSLHSGQLNGQCGVLWTKRIQEGLELERLVQRTMNDRSIPLPVTLQITR